MRSFAERVLQVWQPEISVREQKTVRDGEEERRELVGHLPVHHLEHLAWRRITRNVLGVIREPAQPYGAKQRVTERLGLVPLGASRRVEARDPGRAIELAVLEHRIRHAVGHRRVGHPRLASAVASEFDEDLAWYRGIKTRNRRVVAFGSHLRFGFGRAPLAARALETLTAVRRFRTGAIRRYGT